MVNSWNRTEHVISVANAAWTTGQVLDHSESNLVDKTGPSQPLSVFISVLNQTAPRTDRVVIRASNIVVTCQCVDGQLRGSRLLIALHAFETHNRLNSLSFGDKRQIRIIPPRYLYFNV